MDFGKIFMRQGILLGHFLCDRVQGVERFAAHSRHFPSQVLLSKLLSFKWSKISWIRFLNSYLKFCSFLFQIYHLIVKLAKLRNENKGHKFNGTFSKLSKGNTVCQMQHKTDPLHI